MNREEEIIKAAEETSKAMWDFIDDDYTIPFKHGAKWADSHPVNQWHKVEEFPPKDPNHKGWSVKVIVINDGQHDIGLYDYKLKRWCVPGCINPYFTNITYWQTFPELPKEE